MPNLSRGLNLKTVRRMLTGWQGDPVAATFSEDRKSFITIWDFVRAEQADAERLRLTFINDELEHWGPPSAVATLPFFS